jgi:hypothetical protein
MVTRGLGTTLGPHVIRGGQRPPPLCTPASFPQTAGRPGRFARGNRGFGPYAYGPALPPHRRHGVGWCWFYRNRVGQLGLSVQDTEMREQGVAQ